MKIVSRLFQSFICFCIVMCCLCAVRGDAAIYDGFNYPRKTYDAESSAEMPWKGDYEIVDASLTYHNAGVLDTTGHMLVVTNGMTAVMKFGEEMKEIKDKAERDNVPVIMTFLCKIKSERKILEPFLFLRAGKDSWQIKIGSSNGTFTCSYGRKYILHNPDKRERVNGSLLCLKIKLNKRSFIPNLTVNPMIGIEIANNSESNMKKSGYQLIPGSLKIVAPKGADVYFDELRIGTATREVGFKYKSEQPYSHADVKPTKNIDASSLKSILIIKGDAGTGTGFVVKEGTNIYVYSNLHILTGNRGLKILDNNGNRYEVKKIECAYDRDLVRITLKNPPTSFLTVAEKPKINESISVCGNAGGEGVVRPVFGKLLGFGPKKIETDAGFIPGHSGSPMMNTMNQVVGIASYITIPTTNIINRDTPFTETRRIGYRVDNVPKWLPISSRWFLSEAEKLKKHENNIYAVMGVLAIWSQNPVLSKIPHDDELPKPLNAWIDDHNTWVSRNMSKYSVRSLQRGIPPILGKELLNDVERLEARIKVIFAEKPLRWHLPQFKERWNEVEEYEEIVQKIIGHIKELCK